MSSTDAPATTPDLPAPILRNLHDAALRQRAARECATLAADLDTRIADLAEQLAHLRHQHADLGRQQTQAQGDSDMHLDMVAVMCGRLGLDVPPMPVLDEQPPVIVDPLTDPAFGRRVATSGPGVTQQLPDPKCAHCEVSIERDRAGEVWLHKTNGARACTPSALPPGLQPGCYATLPDDAFKAAPQPGNLYVPDTGITRECADSDHAACRELLDVLDANCSCRCHDAADHNSRAAEVAA